VGAPSQLTHPVCIKSFDTDLSRWVYNHKFNWNSRSPAL